MAEFEYRVIPAPRRGVKAKGIKAAEDQFAHALTLAMNAEAADGWEFVRSDTLPLDERQGLRGSNTTFQSVLVFRRQSAEAAAAALRAASEAAEAQRATLAAMTARAAPEAIPPTPQVKAIEGPKPERDGPPAPQAAEAPAPERPDASEEPVSEPMILRADRDSRLGSS